MMKNGFKPLLVKFSDTYGTPHSFFIKQHKIREESDDKPSDLTLFVCNVPPYYNEKSLKCLFQTCGPVKSVYFAEINSPTIVSSSVKKFSIFDTPTEILGYKVAYVVFQSFNSLQKALSWEPSEPISLSNKFSVVTGLKKWCQKYNSSFVDSSQMQKEIDKSIAKYDKELSKSERLAKKSAEPNDEGWVTVTKKGRNPGFARKQSVKDNLIKKINRKKRKKELLNFYKFQIKESKMNHLNKLRDKFEDDKKKIEQLKMKRKFRPF